MMAITFEDLQKANHEIRTTNIKGKEYAEVNQRIKAFRMVYPEGAIYTEMLFNEGGMCVFKASVYADGDLSLQEILGTGHAYEKESSSFINKTSYIENCETSAVGRALGMAGFGIDISVCSAEELGNAILQQEASRPISEAHIRTISALAEEKGSDVKKICEYFHVGALGNMTEEDYAKCVSMLKAKGEKNEATS